MFGWGKKLSDLKRKEIRAQAIDHTVRFDPSKVSESVRVDLWKNVKSLDGVPPENLEAIYEAALHSISAGRALNVLFDALMLVNGMTKRRASDLSRSLNNKATALIQVESQTSLGIEYAKWRNSGASCGTGNEEHQAADGRTYLVVRGMLLDNHWTWPGRDDGCKCISHAVIPGFED